MIRIISSPRQPLFEELQKASLKHKGGRVRIAVAWAREEGARWLIDALNENISNVEMVVGINEKNTTVEALLQLFEKVKSLSVFFKHNRQTFHPKIYWFSGGTDQPNTATVIVGSSNLTRGGLFINFETSLIVEVNMDTLTEEDKAFLESAEIIWSEFVTSDYSYPVTSIDKIQELYEAGYIVTEKILRKKRRKETRTERPLKGLPTAPPPLIKEVPGTAIAIPFELSGEQDLEQDVDLVEPLTEEDGDPIGTTPLSDRFYVRTLTRNDIAKLHNITPGTFEPDLGQIARNQYPAFWGWPTNYVEVTRNLTRKEWKVEARLFSSCTPDDGIPVILTLWFREARPGHPAEHRIGLGPIGDVRAATPLNFDENSLFVVELASEGVSYKYIIRFITKDDAIYNDYATYLTEKRPNHRYGYGPRGV